MSVNKHKRVSLYSRGDLSTHTLVLTWSDAIINNSIITEYSRTQRRGWYDGTTLVTCTAGNNTTTAAPPPIADVAVAAATPSSRVCDKCRRLRNGTTIVQAAVFPVYDTVLDDHLGMMMLFIAVDLIGGISWS